MWERDEAIQRVDRMRQGGEEEKKEVRNVGRSL